MHGDDQHDGTLPHKDESGIQEAFHGDYDAMEGYTEHKQRTYALAEQILLRAAETAPDVERRLEQEHALYEEHDAHPLARAHGEQQIVRGYHDDMEPLLDALKEAIDTWDDYIEAINEDFREADKHRDQIHALAQAGEGVGGTRTDTDINDLRNTAQELLTETDHDLAGLCALKEEAKMMRTLTHEAYDRAKIYFQLPPEARSGIDQLLEDGENHAG